MEKHVFRHGATMGWQRGKLIFHSETDRGPLEVFDTEYTRSLYFGTRARQSSMYLHDPEQLVLPYTRAMVSAALFNENPKAVLMIGLGGGSLAKFFLRRFSACAIDVVENNPQVVSVARRYFGLPSDERLRIHLGDADHLISSLGHPRPYDMILLDAFTARGVPDELFHGAFLSACCQRLAPNGVLAANLWKGARNGVRKGAHLLRRAGTPGVWQLVVPDRGNIILLASRQLIGQSSKTHIQRRASELEHRLGLPLTRYADRLRPAGRRWLWPLH